MRTKRGKRSGGLRVEVARFDKSQVNLRRKNWYFLQFFCKKRALLCKNCAFFAIFWDFFDNFGQSSRFLSLLVCGGGRFLKIGGLVKTGKFSLSRGAFISGGFFCGGCAISLSGVGGGCGRDPSSLKLRRGKGGFLGFFWLKREGNWCIIFRLLEVCKKALRSEWRSV